ncbi:MAG: M14 family metallopeptidase [Pseudomonadota bacterium]
MKLDHFDHLPAGLAGASPRNVKAVFPRPALISLPGGRAEPLFVSTLLHGNETTSFEVLQHLQARYGSKAPPRSLLIFVGNVDAAAVGVRFLDGQPDFNRIWAHGDSDQHALAREVLSIARRREVFACIDIHNNTGDNPLYGCINALRPADLHLAVTFAPQGVYYRNPPTTLSIAFSALCPSITIECGRSGDKAGADAAIDLVEHAMRLDEFPAHPPPANALALFETTGRVLVEPGATISFGASPADLVFEPDLETRNFKAMAAGSPWARASSPQALRVVDEHGGDMTADFFRFDRGRLVLAKDVVPAMLTRDKDVIAKDCLCYLMTRLR